MDSTCFANSRQNFQPWRALQKEHLLCHVKGVKAVDYPNNHCFELLTEGTRLRPSDIALFVALDDKPHRVLLPLLEMLRQRHNLYIGLAIAKDQTLELMMPLRDNKSLDASGGGVFRIMTGPAMLE
jgi:hypothetical protein